MTFKRITIAFLSALFVCLILNTSICAVPTVYASSVGDYQSQINELEQEQKEIEAEIEKLNSDKSEQKAKKLALQKKIDNLQSQINLCNNRLSNLNAKVATLQKEIEQKEKDFENAKFAFKQRLRVIYMSGGIGNSTLALFLSSEDLGDLLSKSELTKSITAYDKVLTNKIIEDINSISAKTSEIDALVLEQKSIKTELDEKTAELSKQISIVNGDLSDINDKVDELEDMAESIDKAIAEYEAAIKAAQNVGSDQKHDGKFSWPLPGYYTVSSPYGYRTHPISGKWKFHKGVDIAGSGVKGKPIVAAADGIVSIASYNKGGYGNYVMINHGTADDGDKYVTLYAHMTRYTVSVGQTIKKGQTIGYVGTTGASKGYHLHFEIRVNGDTANPMSFF